MNQDESQIKAGTHREIEGHRQGNKMSAVQRYEESLHARLP